MSGHATPEPSTALPNKTYKTHRGLILHVSFAFLSLLIAIGALFLIEGVMHLIHNSLEDISLDDLNYGNVYSTDLGWEPKPNYSYEMVGVTYSTNSSGYRGSEYPFEPTPGKTRVVLTGDSITFGYGVPDKKVFSQILDDENEDLEIVNLGIQGYGTDQALIHLERDGLKYHPDIVIHGFCIANDLLDNVSAVNIYDHSYPKPYFTLENGHLIKHDEHLKLSLFRRAAFFLANRSFLFNYLRNLAGVRELDLNRAIADPVEIEPLDDGMIAEDPNYPAHLSSELVLRMAKVVSEHGARFAVVIFPSLQIQTTMGEQSQIQATDGGAPVAAEDARVKYITSYLEQRGVKVINMRDEFEARGYEGRINKLVRDDSFHLRKRGHQIAADVLNQLIRELQVKK